MAFTTTSTRTVNSKDKFMVMPIGPIRFTIMENRSIVKENLTKKLLDLLATVPKNNSMRLMLGMSEQWDEMLYEIAIEKSIPYWCYIPSLDYATIYWTEHSVTGINNYASYVNIASGAEKVIYCQRGIFDKEKNNHCFDARAYNMARQANYALVMGSQSVSIAKTVEQLNIYKVPTEHWPFRK